MYLYLFLCLQNTGAEIGEFLTPLIFLCHSYKKWNLTIVKIYNDCQNIESINIVKLIIQFTIDKPMSDLSFIHTTLILENDQ